MNDTGNGLPSPDQFPVGSPIPSSENQFRQRVTTGVGITVIVVGLVALIAMTIAPLLLIFLAMLFAIALRGLARTVVQRTGWSDKKALGAVIAAIFLIFVVGAYFLGGQIVSQVEQLAEELPQSVETLRGELERSGWGQALLRQLPNAEDVNAFVRSSFSQATGVFSNALGWGANALVVVFLSITFAFEPEVYTGSLLRLVPIPRRARFREVMTNVSTILGKWLLARFLSMVFVGVLTTIGLMLGGAPLALTMGLIAGITSFIPTFGPVIAVVPAALLALLDGPGTAIYVVILYIVVQQIDNFLLTPILDRTTVSLPAALTIISQLLLGAVSGFMGLTLAAPVAAATTVIVRMLYVEDILNDRIHVPDAAEEVIVSPDVPQKKQETQKPTKPRRR